MIRLATVDLGIKKIKTPVAEICGKLSGKTLLVTAGMDGDENSGIEAAYKIIEEFKDGNLCGNLIVVPIVNVFGFETNTSYNPLDGKFPKDIYPGKENGSSSERLIYWLDNNYVSFANVWLDLHGGAHDEILEPSVLLYESKNKKINEILLKIIPLINNIPKVVFHEPNFWRKTDLLAKKNIAYLISEVGCSGDRNPKWRNKHVDFVKTVMHSLGMIDRKLAKKNKPRVYRKRLRFKAKKAGLWYPEKTIFIKRGQILGRIISHLGKEIQTIIAREEGEFLWGKENLFCRKGDILMEMCSELVKKLE